MGIGALDKLQPPFQHPRACHWHGMITPSWSRGRRSGARAGHLTVGCQSQTADSGKQLLGNLSLQILLSSNVEGPMRIMMRMPQCSCSCAVACSCAPACAPAFPGNFLERERIVTQLDAARPGGGDSAIRGAALNAKRLLTPKQQQLPLWIREHTSFKARLAEERAPPCVDVAIPRARAGPCR